MRYRYYGVRDFAKDPYFQQWVIAPDAESDGFWRMWLAENPEKHFVVGEAKRMVRILGLTDDIELNEAMFSTWNSLGMENIQRESASSIPASYRYSFMLRAASVMLICFLAGTAVWHLYFRMVTIETQFSEIRSVRLPDGSVVDLNANSSIEYASDFNEGDTREVWLKGEAFFNVVHDPARTFIVHTTEGIRVNVLGTTFNVLSRRNTMRVSLNTGKIRVDLGEAFLMASDSSATGGFTMMPGEVAEFDVKTNSISRHLAAVERYASWKERRMIFDNTSMEEVAFTLEDIYGLDVRLDTALSSRRITGEFASDDLDILLQFIARALNADVVRAGDEIHFRGRQIRKKKIE